MSFEQVHVGQSYSRPQLAELWGYSGYQALARGVVTPSGQSHIVLFLTEEKQDGFEQYANRREGERVYWEGPTDHFAEDRMLAAGRTTDQVHVFFRSRHHSDFEYLGRGEIETHEPRTDRPSSFVLKLLEA